MSYCKYPNVHKILAVIICVIGLSFIPELIWNYDTYAENI